MSSDLPIILASSSTTRLELLSRVNIHPMIIPADIDETELPRELPYDLASRLAKSKAEKVSNELDLGYIIGADTVAAVGRRILPKALDAKTVEYCLRLVSGRRHKVYTGIHIIKKDRDNKITDRHRVVETIVLFKRLTDNDIEFYSNCEEGLNKAGGYSAQGAAQSFISFISGSFSNILGLPLFDMRNMLLSLGYDNYR